MKCIAIIATLVVAALAEPEAYYGYGSSGLGYGYGSGYGSGYGYAGRQYGLVSSRPYAVSAPIVKSAPIVAQAPAVPVAAPVQYASTASVRAVPSAPSTSQYHKQDELANFEYGYDNVNSAAIQKGNAYTGVAGTYTVKHPAPGRTISYVADGLGFRVTQESLGRKKREADAEPEAYYGYGASALGYGYGAYPVRSYTNAYASPLAYARPVAAPVAQSIVRPVAAAPAVPVAAPVQYASTSSLRAVPSAPSTSQYHKQDELANFEYGYDNVNSAATQSGNAYTGVAGTYTVKHPAPGRTISYVADGLGFRVTAEHRGKRSVAVVPSTYATAPGTMMVIKYNPGFSTGYRVFH